MTPRRFVVPDIHGCARTFRTLLQDVIDLKREDSLYLLGDYIDRGPRAREVLDLILELRDKGYSVAALRGNHEEMLLNSGNSLTDFHLWTTNGGRATLDSFGVESAGDIPHRYLAFLKQLRYFIVLEDFVIVHACLNFDVPEPFADIEAMLWKRNCEVDTVRLGSKRLINGHVPVTREILLESLNTPRIMLDNGCVYKGQYGLGYLAALELNSMTVYFQENID